MDLCRVELVELTRPCSKEKHTPSLAPTAPQDGVPAHRAVQLLLSLPDLSCAVERSASTPQGICVISLVRYAMSSSRFAALQSIMSVACNEQMYHQTQTYHCCSFRLTCWLILRSLSHPDLGSTISMPTCISDWLNHNNAYYFCSSI